MQPMRNSMNFRRYILDLHNRYNRPGRVFSIQLVRKLERRPWEQNDMSPCVVAIVLMGFYLCAVGLVGAVKDLYWDEAHLHA